MSHNEKLQRLIADMQARKEQGKPMRRKPLPARPTRKDRLNIITSVVHQHQGQDPNVLELRYTNLCDVEEDPISRRYKADEQWSNLDYLFLRDVVGLIVIENLAGTGLSAQPTPQQAEEILRKTLEISYDKERSFYIPVGAFNFFYPSNAESLFIRSQFEETQYRLTVYPK